MLIVVVVTIPVTIAVFVPVAAASHVLEFVAAFFGLSAALAVSLDSLVQLLFRPVNISLASFMSFMFVVGPYRQGRTYQPDDR